MRRKELKKSTHEILQSAEFKSLVFKRWIVSIVLTVLLFVLYYGYIMLIAMKSPIVTSKFGTVTPWAIPLGVGVIVLAWILTAVYVIWANKFYDPEVTKLRDQIRK
jgi:uncharacterized membrane protein (DUF485 family)